MASFKKAVQADSFNALYHYTLASNTAMLGDILSPGKRSQSADAGEILGEIKKGNACVAIGITDYDIAAPTRVRWAFIPYPSREWVNATILFSVLELLQNEKMALGKWNETVLLIRDSADCGRHFLEAAQASKTEEQKKRYLSAGNTLMNEAGSGIVWMKVKGQTVPPDLEYTIGFVPPNHRRGIKYP